MGRFRNQSAFLTLAVVLAVFASAQAPIKVDVRLVPLLVSVKDAQGQLVGSLNKSDFTVFDCGVKQDISIFEHHTALPLSVAVLLDNSGSTAKDLPYETASVEKFLRALLTEGNAKDAASLYSFNDDVVLLSPFTRNRSRLSDSLRLLKSSSGTSMYDAIYLASTRGLEGREGRHVIVIVTDGGDTTSDKRYRDAVEAAHRADAVIYPILVVPITNDAGRNLGGENALKTIALGTGGHVFTPDNVGADLDAAFTDILRDLRTQYLVGYYPHNLPADAPRFRPVSVSLTRKDLRATTRSGYYGDAAPAR